MIEVLAFLEHWRPSQSDGHADGVQMSRTTPRLVQPPASPRQELGLKAAMRQLVGAVSVVTAGIGDDRTGATVTSAHSLSVDPETMMVSINLSSSTWPVIERHGHFCVNILSADQVDVADRFAGRGGLKGADRYQGAEWATLVTGAQALHGALVAIDCEVEHVVKRHSHALIFGAVRAVRTAPGDALVYSHGRYGTLAQAEGAVAR